MKCLWHNLAYFLTICLEGIRYTMKPKVRGPGLQEDV
jgi:hypothetical protein